MEDFPFFQTQDEHFSANSILFPDEEIDQLSNDSASDMLDSKEGLLNWSNQDPFAVADELDLKFSHDLPSLESPILTNALTTSSSVPIKIEPEVRSWPSCADKILFPGDVEPLQVSSGIQTDNLLKRITQARSVLINGEKEIFGKNIIGLHSLNEIKTSPDQNYQITSTVINGKRYKIIIRPKSTGKSTTSPTALRRFIEKPSLTTVKMDPNDSLITELQNGDYDVLGQSLDVLDPWVLTMRSEDEEEQPVAIQAPQVVTPIPPTPEPAPLRVPPLRIKIPKTQKERKTKHKSKKTHCDVETAVAKPTVSTRLPRAPKDKTDSAIVKAVKQLTVAPSEPAMLDHDYCFGKRRLLQPVTVTSPLVEKNPRKDSGLESGAASDVSDAGSPIPAPSAEVEPMEMELPLEPVKSAPILENDEIVARNIREKGSEQKKAVHILRAQQLTSKLLEERLRSKNHKNVTKVAAALFRAANAASVRQKSGESASASASPNASGGGSPGGMSPPNSSCDNQTLIENTQPCSPSELVTERPKKKLKLSDYLNRRNDKKDESTEIVQEVKIKEEPLDALEEGEVLPGAVDADAAAAPTAEVKLEVEDSITVDEEPIVVKQERSDSPVAETHRNSRERMCPAARRQQRRSSSSSSSAQSSRRRRSHRPRGRSNSRGRRRTFWSPTRSSSSDSSSSSSNSSSSRHRSPSTSTSRYRRRSRSRSRSHPRRPSSDNPHAHARSYRDRHRDYVRDRYRSNRNRSRTPVNHREKQRQREERRVVYVGRITEGTTNQQLRQRFSRFGPIVDISLHFRERADNYGFVTFSYKDDAYEAVEHGNDDQNLPRYDLCFGGRRSFCKQRYSDLDGMPTSLSGFNDTPVMRTRDDSFDLLLQRAKEKLHHRKETSAT